jgi:hypothetical protein
MRVGGWLPNQCLLLEAEMSLLLLQLTTLVPATSHMGHAHISLFLELVVSRRIGVS